MYSVYAIKSLGKNYIYVRLTDNLDRRLSRHSSGKSRTTRPYMPFRILYHETHGTRTSAGEYEKYLKSGTGKEFLKLLL